MTTATQSRRGRSGNEPDLDVAEATLSIDPNGSEGDADRIVGAQVVDRVVDILETRLVKRGIAVKSLDYGKIEPAASATVRQVAKVQQGIPSEKAKEIVKAIKDQKMKVQASIQADQVRIAGRSKAELQTAMALIRGRDFGVPLQFTNYR